MIKEPYGFIYIIENKCNDKIYIGQTTNLKLRWKNHRSGTAKGVSLIDSAIAKYGAKKFDFIVVENCATLKELNDKERFWIEILQAKSPNGYNLESGGLSGGKLSKETREKMSQARTGTGNSMFGRKHSNETIEKMRLFRLGKRLPAKTKNKISAAMSGEKNHQYEKPGAFTGRRHSDETKQRMRKSRRKWLANVKQTGDPS